MRKAFLAAGFVGALVASQASAQTITFQNGGSTLLPQETLVETFTLGAGETGRVAIAGATNSFIYAANTPNEAVLPLAGSPNGFAAVLGGGSYTYTLPFAAQVFSFLIGGIDSYNSLTLNYADGTSSIAYMGAAIAGLSSLPSNGALSGRIRFDRGGASSITSVTFASAQNTLEFDDIAIAAPEPATWAMMIFGFGMVGFGLRRRRQSGVLARA
jgi:hypothetical protein